MSSGAVARERRRHVYLVLLLAQSAQKPNCGLPSVSAWAQERLTTIGQACRAVLRETLGKTITWAIERATLDGWQGGEN